MSDVSQPAFVMPGTPGRDRRDKPGDDEKRGRQQSIRLDLSWPILLGSALVLCALIIAPLAWLAYFSVVDRAGNFTFDNFRQLVTTPAFVEPLITTVILSVSASITCC